ncbi:MAG: DJ-1/PfpI family protein [Desulfobacterales bacterium]
MSTIAVIIDELFEDSEYTEPAKAFKENGHQITHVGLEAGKTVTGKKQQTPVVIDKDLDSVSATSLTPS